MKTTEMNNSLGNGIISNLVHINYLIISKPLGSLRTGP